MMIFIIVVIWIFVSLAARVWDLTLTLWTTHHPAGLSMVLAAVASMQGSKSSKLLARAAALADAPATLYFITYTVLRATTRTLSHERILDSTRSVRCRGTQLLHSLLALIDFLLFVPSPLYVARCK